MTFTGKFSKLQNEWKVIVNSGTPQVNDLIRVRKADKSVSEVIVRSLDGTFGGKTVCRFTERRTMAPQAGQVLRMEGVINVAHMRRQSLNRRAQRWADRDNETGNGF